MLDSAGNFLKQLSFECLLWVESLKIWFLILTSNPIGEVGIGILILPRGKFRFRNAKENIEVHSILKQ